MASYIRDIKSNVLAKNSITPAAHTASANGTGCDMGGGLGDGICFAEIYNGTITDGTHTIALEESSDNSTFSSITPIDTIADLTSSTTAGTITYVRFQRTKRYVRAKTTVSGATTGGVYGVYIGEQLKTY